MGGSTAYLLFAHDANDSSFLAKLKRYANLVACRIDCGAPNKKQLCLNSQPTLGKTTTEKIGFYFFTYEWSRRRLSLIKMINGVKEALILLFPAFRYEYLFLSAVVRA